ncbi:DUF1120 domain-containing protein [Achromobacter sp. JUb104]|uniref:DUF1120 domain-containing protein n=1 Tax=Achromobacter sp. JUb104 TaxID=2940590 RepID=UPI0021679936|nr:DUF1120 domain-containing protein [Achromobacter sp. JUb104]MCS3509242.1 type 1 fimbria pilin [Achromobacter sp. JUb104]
MTFTKKISTAAFIAASFAAAAGANAQSIDVRVIGTITPAACTPTIAGGGVIDFGIIPAASLNTTSFTQLPTKSVPFSISCDAPTYVAITAVDNRADSAVTNIIGTQQNYIFGLSKAANANIGGYVMELEQGSFTADGKSVLTVSSNDGGTTWGVSTYGRLPQGALRSWSLTSNGTPVAFTNLAGTFAVTAAINKAEELPLRDEIQLDGLATLEMVYL